jgi:hypothetical protein
MTYNKYRKVKAAVLRSAQNTQRQASIVWNFFMLNLMVFKERNTVAQWLRHCATSQKVAGSIPIVVTGIFH